MIASFSARRLADPRFRYRGSGGPVTVVARSLHARLYGLPTAPTPLPTALDELLQALGTVHNGDQQQAVLAQLAEQLRNAAQILERARDNARQLPTPTWEWLRDATDTTRHLADGLDAVRPSFTTPHAPTATPLPPPVPAPPRAAPARR
ncbi:hypothetical protein A6A06_01630 [Streptomyces sp. CB02923]|uniref:hypothetical protein n=1 Tax=Streptomyces sp. CB02923 TaxID=1718985 RepID=UPI00093BAEA1|nr:hypothetical protein [Streptomyces sp. CB02923]OKI09431.1 hypothetical protein A6A06_01630 [Streptomyces sp. CB02923]